MKNLKTKFAMIVLVVGTLATACNKQSTITNVPNVKTNHVNPELIMKQNQGEVIHGVYNETLDGNGHVLSWMCVGPSPVCMYIVKAKKIKTGTNTYRYEPLEGETDVEYETNDGNDNFITHYCSYLLRVENSSSNEFRAN